MLMAEADNRAKSNRRKKTRDDIKEVSLSGKGPFYNFGDSAVYIGMSEAGFRRWLEKHPDSIQPWGQAIGNERYFLKEDLDKLLEPRPVEE